MTTSDASVSGNPISGLTAPTPAGVCTADPNYSAGIGGTFNFTGGSLIFTAPSSGSLSGFAIWKDGTTSNTSQWTGGGPAISGIIYMPQTALTYTGGISPTQTIIVDTLSMPGGSVSSPASSTYFSSGAGISGNYIVQ
jgi:hypothetical protein